MAYEDLQDELSGLQENTKKYIQSTGNYYKLLGFKIVTRSITLIAKFTLLAICIVMFVLFSSISLAFYLGEIFESDTMGFLAVSGIYLVLGLLFLVIKASIIEGGILRKFSDIFFND